MDSVVSIVGGVPSQVGRNDDDLADRLSYRYTSLLLVSDVAALYSNYPFILYTLLIHWAL